MITKATTVNRTRILLSAIRNTPALKSSRLKESGIIEAIAQLTRDIRAVYGLPIDFIHGGCEETNSFGFKDQLAVYCIIQEYLFHLVSQGRATYTAVHLARNLGLVAIVIEHREAAFDISGFSKTDILGNIRKEVDLYKGQINLRSEAGGAVLEIMLKMKVA